MAVVIARTVVVEFANSWGDAISRLSGYGNLMVSGDCPVLKKPTNVRGLLQYNRFQTLPTGHSNSFVSHYRH